MTLADKLQQSSAGSRDLDAEIALASGKYQTKAGREGQYAHVDTPNQFGSVPRFSTSLDAAMTLIPAFGDGEYGERVNIGLWDSNGVHAKHIRATAWVCGAPRAYAATPALALSAAAIQAQEG